MHRAEVYLQLIIIVLQYFLFRLLALLRILSDSSVASIMYFPMPSPRKQVKFTAIIAPPKTNWRKMKSCFTGLMNSF